MANKITQEQIEQINELYLIYKVKSKVAKEVGVSAASVSKYIIDGYISKENRVESKCSAEVNERGLVDFLKVNDDETIKELSKAEWEDLKELQKEVFE